MYIINDYVNARSSPTTSDDTNKLLYLRQNTCLKYLDKEDDESGMVWYQVQLFDGVEAYVRADMATLETEINDNTVVDVSGNILYYHNPDIYLDEYRMMVNASYIYNNLICEEKEIKFNELGEEIIINKWTPNAIYGLLGNVAVESRVNPGYWQNHTQDDLNGFGLTQWTPSTKYTSWIKTKYGDMEEIFWNMDYELEFLRYEVYQDMVNPNANQWHSSGYGAGMTFEAFTQSTAPAEELGEAFLRGYEKPSALLYGSDTEKQKCVDRRRRLARNWKEFFESNKTVPYKHEVD